MLGASTPRRTGLALAAAAALVLAVLTYRGHWDEVRRGVAGEVAEIDRLLYHNENETTRLVIEARKCSDWRAAQSTAECAGISERLRALDADALGLQARLDRARERLQRWW